MFISDKEQREKKGNNTFPPKPGKKKFPAKNHQKNQKFAFVVGCSDYKNIEKLSNGANDARSVCQALERLGWKVTLEVDCDRARFILSWNAFVTQFAPGCLVAIFYAGHASEHSAKNYLLPIDTANTTVGAAQVSGIVLDDLLEQLKSKSTRANILMVDACRSKPKNKRGITYDATMKIPIQGTQTITCYACRRGATAFDGESSHSPFTEGLLKHIHSGDHVENIFRKVAFFVVEETQKLCPTQPQRPTRESDVLEELYF